MDVSVGQRLRNDLVKKLDERFVPIALHVLTDDGSVEHVEGRECCVVGPMKVVVMGHPARAPRLEAQARLGAVKGLDLALLVDCEDEGMRRRIDLEADEVAQLVGERGIVGQFELTHAMGLQTVPVPDALDRTDADPGGFHHHGTGPVGRLPGRRLEGQRKHAVDDFLGERREV